jgi:hypothetical protein
MRGGEHLIKVAREHQRVGFVRAFFGRENGATNAILAALARSSRFAGAQEPHRLPFWRLASF